MSDLVKATVNISRTYKSGQTLTKEEFEQLPGIDVRQLPAGVPTGTVTVGTRITKNLGNFESVQIYVEVSFPTVLEEASECYDAAQAFVEKKLSEQLSIVDQHRNSKK